MKITHLIKLLSLLLLLSISHEAQLKRSKYSLLSSENEQELNYENSESHIYDHILGFFSAFSSEVSQSKEGVDIIASTRPECSEKSLKTLFTYGRINYVKYLENVQKATQNEKPQQSISERIRQCELHKKELLNEIEALEKEKKTKKGEASKEKKNSIQEITDQKAIIKKMLKDINNAYKEIGTIVKSNLSKKSLGQETIIREKENFIKETNAKLKEEMAKLDQLNEKNKSLFGYKELTPLIKEKKEEAKINCVAYAQNPNDAYAMSTFKKIIHFYDFARQTISCASENKDIQESIEGLIEKVKSAGISMIDFISNIIEKNPMEIVKMFIKAPFRVGYAFTKFCFHLRRLTKNKVTYEPSQLAYQQGKVMGYGMKMLFGLLPES